MWPPSRMCGRHRRVTRSRPLTFVSSTVRSSSSVLLSNGSRPSARPAPLSRMSTAPSSATAASTNRRQLSGSVTSTSSATSASIRSVRRAPPTTRTPSARSCSIVAAPIPLDAPVTTAVLPSRLPTAAGLALAELDAVDRDVLVRLVAPVARDLRDRVDHVHPGRDLAEDGVLAVEPRRGLGRDDEELAAVRVRPRVRHRERAADDLVLVELVLELVAGTARPGARRVAALDHEVRDHAVEDDAVVEAVARELREVLDGLGRIVVEELERDVAVVGVERRRGHGRTVPDAAAGTPQHGKRCQTRQVISYDLWSRRPAAKPRFPPGREAPYALCSLETPVRTGRRDPRAGSCRRGCGGRP